MHFVSVCSNHRFVLDSDQFQNTLNFRRSVLYTDSNLIGPMSEYFGYAYKELSPAVALIELA